MGWEERMRVLQHGVSTWSDENIWKQEVVRAAHYECNQK
jgi:hypothetical protein